MSIHDVDIGLYVISRLLQVGPSMLMVDRVTELRFSPPSRLVAERYVSADDPIFEAHFPDVQLWPGIYTIEGLRQCCELLDVLVRIEAADLLPELFDGEAVARPGTDTTHAVWRELAEASGSARLADALPLRIKTKLLAPVRPECVIQYSVLQEVPGVRRWVVHADVDGVAVARGEVMGQSSAHAQRLPPDLVG